MPWHISSKAPWISLQPFAKKTIATPAAVAAASIPLEKFNLPAFFYNFCCSSNDADDDDDEDEDI